MSTLHRAIQIAYSAHEGQTDKAGAPYILHPIRVMLRVSDPEAQMAAVLHDVVEDSEEWSLARLESEGFSPLVLDIVRAMTKESGLPYSDYIERISKAPAAIEVKLADLEDNLDTTRLSNPLTAADHDRIARYEKARAKLREVPAR